ncbi:MAG: methyl-accepting chemotaxis protein [Cypionkella sp.]
MQKFSVRVSTIIGVIDDIAFQTNLLALSAGGESARTGDAGVALLSWPLKCTPSENAVPRLCVKSRS